MEFRPLFFNTDGRQEAGPTFDLSSPQAGDTIKYLSGKWVNQPAAAGEANVILSNVPCHSSVEEGHVVRMSSGIAILALANSITNSNAIGVVESKVSTTVCNIRVSGVSSDLFVDLDETKEYFLSAVDAGELTITAPTLSGSVALKMGQPFTATRFFVNKGSRIVRS